MKALFGCPAHYLPRSEDAQYIIVYGTKCFGIAVVLARCYQSGMSTSKW